MRRTLWFRSLASLLALWLPLIAGEPGLLHPCPMHGAGQAVVASLRGQSVHAPAAQPATTHSHHAAAASAASDDHSGHAPVPGHGHHDCTCIECCAASAAVFLAPGAPAVALVVADYAAGRSVPSVESLARPAPEYSRPYTTGPPRA